MIGESAQSEMILLEAIFSSKMTIAASRIVIDLFIHHVREK